MRYSYLLALLIGAMTLGVARAQEDGDDLPPPPPPPPPQDGGEGGEGGEGPPPQPPPSELADGQGPPGPPGPPPRPLGPPPGPPGGFNSFGGKREGEELRRPSRKFRQGEEILIRGGRSCYFRPACAKEQAQSRFKGQLKDPRILCARGKPTAQQREYVWKAHPCTSPEGKLHHFVRFENGKHPGKFLCITDREFKAPKRRYGRHLAILGCKKKGGCRWKVKEAKVYNRQTKKLETRFVFVNKKHRHYMLRARRRCKLSPPGPRRVFAGQNYLSEGRVDTMGSVAIEPVAAQPTGYDV
jgi:hypothetical protein